MQGINLRRAGRGRPVLLIHGIGGELHVWDPVFARLAEQRDVIAVDLPGFGDSPPLAPPLEPSPAALAQALGTMLDELGVGEVDVVGNSLGGWVALELGRQRRTQSVLALCPAGLWSAPLLPEGAPARNVSRRLAARLAPLLRAAVATRAGRNLIFSRFMAHPQRLSGAAARRMLDGFLSAPGYAAANMAMRRRRADQLEEIRAPVTVAWGERDRVVRRSPRVPPGATVLDLPGCGHIPMWDDPQLVVDLILQTSAAPAAVQPA